MDNLIPIHPNGERIDAVGHMCPDCGPTGVLLCRWCMGTGLVTTARLADWQREENTKLAAS